MGVRSRSEFLLFLFLYQTIALFRLSPLLSIPSTWYACFSLPLLCVFSTVPAKGRNSSLQPWRAHLGTPPPPNCKGLKETEHGQRAFVTFNLRVCLLSDFSVCRESFRDFV
ncbi:uncharacterized protein BJX67DRAFT_349438 [Aspergillus lucknowensis]|uniref:Secreted protein n=1 Tax=Aspergillus lucknowensis TaxID=176173 RepID=A0ABR4LWK0_9EURO